MAESQGKRVLDLVRWGLVPSWAKSISVGDRMINARAERHPDEQRVQAAVRAPALHRRRRRLLRVADDRRPQAAPAVVHPAPRRRAARVRRALVDLARPADSATTRRGSARARSSRPSRTISCGPIHDRMPVILPESEWDAWLDAENHDVKQLARAARSVRRRTSSRRWPVSTLVNKPANNGPELLERRAGRFPRDGVRRIRRRDPRRRRRARGRGARARVSTRAVPSCPEWTVADLLGHVGRLHRWVAQIVVDRATDRGEHWSDVGAAAARRARSTGSRPAFRPARRRARGGGPGRRDVVVDVRPHAAVSGRGARPTRPRCTAATRSSRRARPQPIEHALAVDGIDELFDSDPVLARGRPSARRTARRCTSTAPTATANGSCGSAPTVSS